MPSLIDLIVSGEELLVEKVLLYADKAGYSRYTPSDKEAWRKAVKGLSKGLTEALSKSREIPELSPELDFANDSITAFGVEQARKHRSRGVTMEMFLGLMKYFRQSYQDYISGFGLKQEKISWVRTFVDRYFDRIELGFMAEWERAAEELNARHEQLLIAKNAELVAANGKLQLEIQERKKGENLIRKLNADLERMVAARTMQLQRLGDQNSHKLKELILLNRLSRVNLSTISLNKLTHLILASLISGAPLFFDRAMLFLANERSEMLQGMLGMMRGEGERAFDSASNEWHVSDEEVARFFDSELSSRVRSCRLELKKGKRPTYRALTEKKVIRVKKSAAEENLEPALMDQFDLQDFAVMPLMGKDRVFGVVIVDNPLTGRDISRDDARFLQLFSNHAGIAIENLMLYTKLEDANRRLHEAQEQLLHGERLATLGEMAAGVAHELKGPMVSIGGFARRLSKTMHDDSPEAQYVATIIEESLRLENMLTDILSFSRKTTICYENCSIADILDGALAIVAHGLEKNRITLSRSYPKKQIFLYGDCQQLKQVFINLFNNAIEVMRGDGELKVGFAQVQIDNEKSVVVRISDTGPGIPAGMLNSIFNPFFTTRQNGTGLGLPICNRIVTNHGGRIRVRNLADGGAEFSVFLPCRS